MSNASDFVIENGVLKKYVGPGGDVVVPEGVTEIGKGVFAESKTLTGVTLPQSLKIIGAEAFASCNGLTSVTIPRGVTKIWFGGFDWCKNLKDVYIDDLSAWCRIEFGGVYANCGNPLSAGARLHVNGKVLTELVIPEGVENVGNYTFFRCAGLENAVIPDGVTSIGEYAFFECTNLKSISLPDSLTSIGNGAFLRCKKLIEVSIPKTVTNIGDRAFMECRKLADVILPEGVELLGDKAFGDCGQLRISLPGSLKRPKANRFGRLWEKAPFAGSACSIRIEKWSALITKMVDGCTIKEINTASYSLIPGEIMLPVAVSMMKKKDWDPMSETGKALLDGLGKNAGKSCAIALTNVEWLRLLCVNKLIKAKDLDAYLEEAEKKNNTEAKAMLLNYQNELGSKAVEKAREKKENDKEAYTDALVKRAAKRDPANGIEGMTFVVTGKFSAWPKVWSSRKEVEDYLTKYGAKLGSSLTKETDYLVTNDKESGSAKTEKAKKLGVEVISEEEFNQMIGRRFIEAETIIVPSWVKTIEPAAFSRSDWQTWNSNDGYKKLRKVILPEGISRIGEKAFAGAENLESICVPKSVTVIDGWAFAGCAKLTAVDLPSNLICIGARAFHGCSGITKITIPEGTKAIGIGAFAECSSLKEVLLPASLVKIDTSVIDDSSVQIHVCNGSCAEEYARKNGLSYLVEADAKKDDNNGHASEKNEIGEAGSAADAISNPADFSIENGVLKKYVGHGGDVTIPEGVTDIGAFAFSKSYALTSLLIPEGVQTIGMNAFSDCVSLTSVKLPNSLKSIESGAFSGCASLTQIDLPDELSKIGEGAFRECTSLSRVRIPESVTEIKSGTFLGCRGLKDQDGFVIIRSVLHSYHGAGGDVVIPEGVKEIGSSVFFEDQTITNVTIPDSVAAIGDFAFSYCSLKTIKIPENVKRIGNLAFSECEIL